MNEKVIINVDEDEMRVPKQVYSFQDYFELWIFIYRWCNEFVMLLNFLVVRLILNQILLVVWIICIDSASRKIEDIFEKFHMY